MSNSHDAKLSFEKFMRDIEKRDNKVKEDISDYQKSHQDNPERARNNLYAEKWQNSVRYRRQK